MFDALVKGGWMMLPLAACSLVSLTIIIERFFLFSRMGSPDRATEVITLVGKRQTEEAMAIAEEAASPVMRVLGAGMTHRREPSRVMESAGTAELSTMRRGLPALDTIITLSPLLGLLGTILGMIKSFHIMGTSGLGQCNLITGGVAEALVCTAAGITVAVVTLIPYNYFQARIEREADAMETYATRLEIALAGGKE
jgi:biopolymer transport protein ExbB